MNEMTMLKRFGDNVDIWHFAGTEEREREHKEQQLSNKQQMASPTSRNSQRVFIDEAPERLYCSNNPKQYPFNDRI